MSLTATTTISTVKASGYLQQLCKHFGHKTDVKFDRHNGRINFMFGHAALTAGPERLALTATANNTDDLERLKKVLSSHLERFAFREELDILWS